jgi:hypothetical protein
MLDHGIRAGKDQGDVLVLELHEVWRLPARSADFDDLTGPLWLTHDGTVYVDHIPDDCLHDACLLGQGSHSPLSALAVPTRRTRAGSTQAGRESIHRACGDGAGR